MKTIMLCSVVLCLLSSILPCQTAPRYWIADLGYTNPIDVNILGQVVGGQDPEQEEDTNAFVWRNGTLTDLGTLTSGAWSEARAINDRGDIVGTSDTIYQDEYGTHSTFHAFFLSAKTGMADLTNNTDSYSAATDINKSGQIVGWTHIAGPFSTAWLWKNGKIISLGLGTVYAINDAGQVVGSLMGYGGYLWKNGKIIGLNGIPMDINNEGQMVGYGPVAWNDGIMKSLPVPMGSSWGEARKINNFGQIIGNVQLSYGGYHPFLWSLAGEAADLNDLIHEDSGWELLNATSINDNGLIVGTAIHSIHGLHGYLLTPIIDVQPRQYPNTISLGSNTVVKVAVTTTHEFDATTLDPSEARFAGAKPTQWKKQDTDGDGDTDLLLCFRTRDLALTESSTEAILTCKTHAGKTVEGSDSLLVVSNGRQ